MSFEQSEKNADSEKKRLKKESERHNDFLVEKRIMRESNALLEKLTAEIARDFGIDILQAQELILENTGKSLESFKNNLESHLNINVFALEEAINNAKQSISNLSIQSRQELKNTLLTTEFKPHNYQYKTSQFLFGNNMRNRAQNPKNLFDQGIGLSIGVVDSSEALILLTYGVGKGVILSPYHLYKILTGKVKYDGLTKI
ncbi:hypothetical protein GW846_01205 [Candidatus Gracilibacteria bacterium]|nr:hypothetical protein [Candidatus Gracilibacteria bacterium]